MARRFESFFLRFILGYGVMAVTRVFGTLSPSSNLGSPTITGDLRCGNRHLRGVRLVNSSYGNKPKEFESLRLTILIGTKQLSVTLLNSVITLKLIKKEKKRKNVR